MRAYVELFYRSSLINYPGELVSRLQEIVAQALWGRESDWAKNIPEISVRVTEMTRNDIFSKDLVIMVRPISATIRTAVFAPARRELLREISRLKPATIQSCALVCPISREEARNYPAEVVAFYSHSGGSYPI